MVEVFDRLGGMTEAIKNVNENLQAMRTTQDRMAAQADERDRDANRSRQRLHERVDEVKDRVSDLDKKVEIELRELNDRVDDVDAKAASAKEAGDDYRRMVQQGKGALLVVGFGGTAFGAAAVAFFDTFTRWFRAKLGL